jgi:hypothetical protein
MLSSEPNFPQVVLSFIYRDVKLELDQSEENGVPMFSVWASFDQGYAVAVPGVVSRREAIYKAKTWVDQRATNF